MRIVICGINCRMKKAHNIASHVPAKSLGRATAVIGGGIAEIVNLGLDPIVAAKSAEELRRDHR